MQFEMSSLAPFIELEKAYLDTIESHNELNTFQSKAKDRLY